MSSTNINEFENAPLLVQQIKSHAFIKQPISMAMYKEAIEKHPEYFPKEVELIRKWESVPKHIMDAYNKEKEEVHAKAFSNLPPSKGFFYWIRNEEEYLKWKEAFDKCMEEEQTALKPIREKYLAPYGL